jgi:hypothetical protein
MLEARFAFEKLIVGLQIYPSTQGLASVLPAFAARARHRSNR